jgi:hypothetical protein
VCSLKVSIKGAAAGSGQSASEKEWNEQRLSYEGRKITKRSAVLVDAQLSKEKSACGQRWEASADQVSVPGGPLKLHLNRGLQAFV